jgi:hypothetical protein
MRPLVSITCHVVSWSEAWIVHSFKPIDGLAYSKRSRDSSSRSAMPGQGDARQLRKAEKLGAGLRARH